MNTEVTSKYIDAWPIIKELGVRGNRIRDYGRLYYRSTKYTPESELMEVNLHWAIHRDWDRHGVWGKPTWECCIAVDLDHSDPWRRNIPWFIWDDVTGNDCLVLEPSNEYSI